VLENVAFVKLKFAGNKASAEQALRYFVESGDRVSERSKLRGIEPDVKHDKSVGETPTEAGETPALPALRGMICEDRLK
jgi:hypothetical protein